MDIPKLKIYEIKYSMSMFKNRLTYQKMGRKLGEKSIENTQTEAQKEKDHWGLIEERVKA